MILAYPMGMILCLLIIVKNSRHSFSDVQQIPMNLINIHQYFFFTIVFAVKQMDETFYDLYVILSGHVLVFEKLCWGKIGKTIAGAMVFIIQNRKVKYL